MKIDSIKLHIQDMPDKKGKLFAVVAGKVTLDTGETAKEEDGITERLDGNGDIIPLLDDINIMFSLNKEPAFREMIQAISMEALTLKNLEIAEENGQISHFVKTITGQSEKKGSKITKAKVKRKKK